jgi:hypothetical protein
MYFPQPHAPDEYGMGMSFDKVQPKELLDLHAVDLLGPIPLERLERFEHGKARRLEAALECAILAPLCFAFDELGQVIDVRALLVRGLTRQVFEVFADKVQFQIGQQFGQGGV